MENTAMTYERANARLEEIVRCLESGQGSLEEMIELYQEGVRLHGICSGILDSFEQKLLILKPEDGEEA